MTLMHMRFGLTGRAYKNKMQVFQETMSTETAMRIEKHPILEFKKGRKVKFHFDGSEMAGFEGEMIASALMANGVKVFRHSRKLGRPRGFFCAIGRCASCNMVVNGVPNVRVCVTPLREGMTVETQKGMGVLKP